MNSAGNEVDVIIPSRLANRGAFILFAIAVVSYGLPFSMMWGLKMFLMAAKEFLTGYLYLTVSLVGGIVVHELLHAVTWAVFCKQGMRSVRFGIDWRNLSPYVHCSEYLWKRFYVAGVAMPLLILGIVPALIAMFTGNGWLIWFGVFFTAGAAGDVLALVKLRSASARDEILDHREHLGFTIRRSAP